MNTRSTAYFDLEEKFAFFVNLSNLNHDQITESCKKVALTYPNDLCEEELIQECEIAKEYFEFDTPDFSHRKMYSTIIKDGLICTMPNIEIILRIFLSLFCTNVPDERSFSKLKYVKNYLRSTMCEEKLISFALLSIEHDILKSFGIQQKHST